MKKVLGIVQFLLMFGFIALSLCYELFDLTHTHLVFALIVISIVFILMTVYVYKKYGDTKLTLFYAVESIVFVVTSLLDTFEIIEFQTYIVINLVVDGIGFWLENKQETTEDCNAGDGTVYRSENS